MGTTTVPAGTETCSTFDAAAGRAVAGWVLVSRLVGMALAGVGGKGVGEMVGVSGSSGVDVADVVVSAGVPVGEAAGGGPWQAARIIPITIRQARGRRRPASGKCRFLGMNF